MMMELRSAIESRYMAHKIVWPKLTSDLSVPVPSLVSGQLSVVKFPFHVCHILCPGTRILSSDSVLRFCLLLPLTSVVAGALQPVEYRSMVGHTLFLLIIFSKTFAEEEVSPVRPNFTPI